MRGESGCGSESVSTSEEGELQDVGEGRNSGSREMGGGGGGGQRKWGEMNFNIFPRFLFMHGIKNFILFCVVSWEAVLFSLHYFSLC